MAWENKFTDDELLNALRKVNEYTTGSLTMKKYDEAIQLFDDMPASSTIEQRLGGWNNAKIKAGIMESKQKYGRYTQRVDYDTFCKDCAYFDECKLRNPKKCKLAEEAELYYHFLEVS